MHGDQGSAAANLDVVRVAREVVEGGVAEQLPAVLEACPRLQALVKGDEAALVDADVLPHQAAVLRQGRPVHARLRLCAPQACIADSPAPAVLHADSSKTWSSGAQIHLLEPAAHGMDGPGCLAHAPWWSSQR